LQVCPYGTAYAVPYDVLEKQLATLTKRKMNLDRAIEQLEFNEDWEAEAYYNE
jgi:hypothetical protein